MFLDSVKLPRVGCPEPGPREPAEPVEGLCFVYVLECRNGTLYVGHTQDVAERLKLHEQGLGARHTRLLAPFSLVYVEGPMAETKAIKRERQLKKWSRDKKLALIQGRLSDLRKLSRSREGKNSINE